MFERDDVCSLQIPNDNARGENSGTSTWNGACVDTGAQKTVIGLPQAMASCRFVGKKFKLQRSNNVYRFGVDKQDSLGFIAIHIPTPASVISLNVDVVRANVPLLIGLDVLDANDLTADTMSNKLRFPKGGWETPLVRKIGHVYLKWSYEGNILFSKSELTKMHRGFYHPSGDNLLNILKRARPDDTNQETIKLLQQIASACETGQKLGPKPIRLKVSLPNMEDIVLGDELSINLMFIDGQTVLHVIDTATRFSAATFLDSHNGSFGQSGEGVWLALIETWFTLYTGYPNRLRIDAGIYSLLPDEKNSPTWQV
jgi:hypothetical protein